MRIVHTADWHVGRLWKGLHRLDEAARVLDHLARYLEREQIDLLLVAGDVFDVPNPGAEAEAIVFGFFRRLGARQIPVVVIAGNHDSPSRMDACGQLAELAGVRIVGKPRPVSGGGIVEVITPRGEIAQVAALPFAAPGVFVSALELGKLSINPKMLYAERFHQAIHHLTQGFRPHCFHLLMAHTYLDGAVLANSERLAHIGEEWAANPLAFPNTVDYVALGHIHKPQRIDKALVPTEYSGSLLQLDFGEVNQPKSFVVIDLQPGQSPRIERIPSEGGKSLVDCHLSLEELPKRESELRSAGWLRLTISTKEADPDLARKVRERLPNALVIRHEQPMVVPTLTPSRAGKSPIEMYRDYHLREYGQLPSSDIEEAFQTLYTQCGE